MAGGETLVGDEMSPSWTEHLGGPRLCIEGTPCRCPLPAGRGG